MPRFQQIFHFLDRDASRRRSFALAAFLAVLLLTLSSAFFHITRSGAFDANLGGLLPNSLAPELSPALEERLKMRLAATGSTDLVATIGLNVKAFPKDQLPSKEVLDELLHQTAFVWVSVVLENAAISPVTTTSFKNAITFPETAAGNLLTEGDVKRFQHILKLPPEVATQRLASRAAACLSPGAARLLGFNADPFCTFDRWALERAKTMPWQEVDAEGKSWLELKDPEGTHPTLALFLKADSKQLASGNAKLVATLERAKEAATKKLQSLLPEGISSKQLLTLDAAGVPLFTDVIASRAKADIAFIGILSTVGVLILAAFFFASLRVIVLLASTVVVGLIFSTGVTFAVFGHLSLVTFVFGMTLIGVSIDYGAHWFVLRTPSESVFTRRRHLGCTLLLAALSSGAAYTVLAAAPIPGLKQMALLATTGLVGALATVLIALPVIEVKYPQLCPQATDGPPLLKGLVARLPLLPRLRLFDTYKNRSKCTLPRFPFILLLLWTLLIIFGVSRLHLSSGIRDLQGAPAALLEAQERISTRLALPSPAQCFVIEAKTLDLALEAEVQVRRSIALNPALQGVRTSGLSEWLPSVATQNASRELIRKAVSLASPALENLLGVAPKGPSEQALTLKALEAQTQGRLSDTYVLENDASDAALLLLLSGVTPENLTALKTLDSLSGNDTQVTFIDITQGMSEGLSHCRNVVLALLSVGLVLLFIALTLKFGRHTWRAVLPALIGILTATAILGLTGQPLTLFAALAMVLLVGLGLDYGIFFTEHPNDGRTSAAIVFSGLTTMLSFGLLAFSSTPALRTFGSTLLVGLVAIWVAASLLRPDSSRMKCSQSNN